MSARRAFLLLGLLSFANFAFAGEPPELRAGQTRILARADASRLIGIAEDLRIAFVEKEGGNVVARITPITEAGSNLGGGRVIAVAALERYEVSLRELFPASLLDGTRLRVEVLRGKGRLEVLASSSDGADLSFGPEQEHMRRRPVRLRSSNTLIDEAEASGAIDAETAMLYRVFVIFDDARLPAQYRGIEVETEDSLYMSEVREKFDSLSTATQELLAPFLAPPAYVGSWASPSGSGVTTQAVPPPCQAFSGAWGFVDATLNVPVRVWFQRGSADEIRANSIASFVQSAVWPKFTDVMKTHVPLSDLTESCNGGDGRLDIYLTNIGFNGLAYTYRGCSNSPAFLLVSRTAPNRTVAHEIFHAFQHSFAVPACLGHADYNWWTEGSATWSTDLVDRAVQWEHNYALKFLDGPDKPLDFVDGYPCDRCYGTYLLPFYLERSTNSTDFVRVAWENCTQEPALEAVDRAVSGGFEKVWKEFVLRNWNRDAIKDYRDWDSFLYPVKRVGNRVQEVRLAGSTKDMILPITVNLPRLSATYSHYKFTDDNVRTVAFWNGATMALSQRDEYQVEEATADQKKGGHIWALVKLKGKDWTTEDWTNRDAVAFCRDRGQERLEELVVIISNSEFSNRNRRLQSTGLSPLLWVSNMGCYKWEGTSNARVGVPGSGNSVIEISATATFTSFGTRPPFIFYSVQGGQNWSVGGGSCSGGGSLPLAPGVSFLISHNFTPPGGTKHRGYIVAGGQQIQNVTITCSGQTATITLPPWVFDEHLEPPLLVVQPTGFVIDDTRPPTADEPASYIWHFEAKRDP